MDASECRHSVDDDEVCAKPTMLTWFISDKFNTTLAKVKYEEVFVMANFFLVVKVLLLHTY